VKLGKKRRESAERKNIKRDAAPGSVPSNASAPGCGDASSLLAGAGGVIPEGGFSNCRKWFR